MLRRWILPLLLILLAGAGAALAILSRRPGAALPGATGAGGEPAAPPPAKAPERDRPFALLFGGELGGRLWTPPCSQFRQGGLLRIVPVIHAMSSHANASVLLDGGDLAGAPGEAGAVEFRTGLTALKDAGLAVTAVGEKDLLLGLDVWRREKGGFGEGVAVLCANLRDDQDRPLAPAVAHLVVGRKKVVVTAVLSPSFEKELRDAGVPVRLLPAAAAVKEALSNAGKFDFAVLLSHAPPEESRLLAREIPSLDAVVTAHAGTLPWLEPEIVDGRPVFAPGSGWQYVGGAVFKDMGEGKRGELVDSLNRAVGWTVEPFQPVDLLLNRASMELGRPGFLAAALKASSERRPAGTAALAGAESCASCHPEAHRTWKEGDGHAKSMEGVRKLGFGFVPFCLSCHATAPGSPGGHREPGDAQAAVACEACHGPGGEHVAADGRVRLADAKASCRACHVPEMSPGFSFEEAWPKIVHGR